MSCRSVLLSRFGNACEELLNAKDASAGDLLFCVAEEIDELSNHSPSRIFQRDDDGDFVYSHFVRAYSVVVSSLPADLVPQEAKLKVALSQIAKCLVSSGTERFTNATFCFEVMKLALEAVRNCGDLGFWADSQTALAVAFSVLECLGQSRSPAPEEEGLIKKFSESTYSLQMLVSYQTRQYEQVATILRVMDKTYSGSTWKMACVTCYNIGSQYLKEKSYAEAIYWLELCLQAEVYAGRELTKEIRNRITRTLSSALLKQNPKEHWPRVFQLLEDADPTAESLKLKLYVLLFARQKDETLVSCLSHYLDSLVNDITCVDAFREEFWKLFSVLLQYKRYAAALAALDQRGWLREEPRWTSPRSEPLRKSVRWISISVAIKCCLNLEQERDMFNLLQETTLWEKALEKDIPMIVEAMSVAQDALLPWVDRGYYEQSLDCYKTLIELSVKQGLTGQLGTMVRNAVVCALRSARQDKLLVSQQLLSIVDSEEDIDVECLRLQLAILRGDKDPAVGSIERLGTEFQKGMDKKVAVVDGLCKCVKTAVDLGKMDAAMELFHYAVEHAGVCRDMGLELVHIELSLEYEMLLKTGSDDDISRQRILDQMLRTLDLVIVLVGNGTVTHPDEELAELLRDRALSCATVAWNVASSTEVSKCTRRELYLKAYRLFSVAGYGRIAVEKTSHCVVLVILTGLQAAAESKDNCTELYDECLQILDEFDRYKVCFQVKRSDKNLTIDEGVIRLLFLFQILLLAKTGKFAQVRSLSTSYRRQMQAGLIQPNPETLGSLSLILAKMDSLPENQDLALQFLEDALYTCISGGSHERDQIDRLLYKIIGKSIGLASAGVDNYRKTVALMEKVLKKFIDSKTPEMYQYEISWIAALLSVVGFPVKGNAQIEENRWINLLQDFYVSFPDFAFLPKLLSNVSSK